MSIVIGLLDCDMNYLLDLYHNVADLLLSIYSNIWLIFDIYQIFLIGYISIINKYRYISIVIGLLDCDMNLINNLY